MFAAHFKERSSKNIKQDSLEMWNFTNSSAYSALYRQIIGSGKSCIIIITEHRYERWCVIENKYKC